MKTGKATIADDAATSLTPELQSGLIIITVVGTDASTQGIFAFDAASGGATCTLVTTATNMAATTGALTGTTGTDTELTVSAHTDGKIYIENRLGAQKNVHWITFT